MDRSIAKDYAVRKQNIAHFGCDTSDMGDRSINQVFAEALRRSIEAKNISAREVARRAKLSEGTVRNAMNPDRRANTTSGKEPSIKLTEAQAIADVLGVHLAELVRAQEAEKPSLAIPTWEEVCRSTIELLDSEKARDVVRLYLQAVDERMNQIKGQQIRISID